MAELKPQKTSDSFAALPSAKELMEQIALKEFSCDDRNIEISAGMIHRLCFLAILFLLRS